MFLKKFEASCGCVYSVDFHPKRPWMIVGCQSGDVIIYNYTLHIIVTTYQFTTSPIRAVVFHPTLPYFASAGDDRTVRLVDFQKEKVIATNTTHTDYVRSLAFHPTLPWLASGSDDMIARVWNFQTDQRLGCLVGHASSVLSVDFHPSLPFLLTSSYDSTVRIWDISELSTRVDTGKMTRLLKNAFELPVTMISTSTVGVGHAGAVASARWLVSSSSAESMSFVSVGNDGCMRVWDGTPATRTPAVTISPVQSSPASSSNKAVFSALALSHTHFIVGGKTGGVRLYANLGTKTGTRALLTDRSAIRAPAQTLPVTGAVWSLAAHPSRNIFAVGHAGGAFIFTAGHERPAFAVAPASRRPPGVPAVTSARGETVSSAAYSPVVYVEAENGTVEAVTLGDGLAAHEPVYKTIGTAGHGNGQPELARAGAVGEGVMRASPRGLYMHTGGAETDLPAVITYTDGRNNFSRIVWGTSAEEAAPGPDTLLVPAGRDTYAGLSVETPGGIDVYSLMRTSGQWELRLRRTLTDVATGARAVLEGGAGAVLVVFDTEVALVDVREARPALSRLVTGCLITQAVWSTARIGYVALIGKKNVFMVERQADNTLTILATNRSVSRIKGAIWTTVPTPARNEPQLTAPRGDFLIFCTNTHVHYMISSGDSGVLTSVHRPVYPVALVRNHFWYLDRMHRLQFIGLEMSVAAFQYCLHNKITDKLVYYAKQCRNGGLGLSLLTYLYTSGHYDVALLAAEDPRTRFALATRSGNLVAAREAAAQLPKAVTATPFAAAAFRQGDAGEALATLGALGTTSSAGTIAYYAATSGHESVLAAAAASARSLPPALATPDRASLHALMQLALTARDYPLIVTLLGRAGQHGLAFLTALRRMDEPCAAELAVLADEMVPSLPPNFRLPGEDGFTRDRLVSTRQRRLARADLLPPPAPATIAEVLEANRLDPHTRDPHLLEMAQRELAAGAAAAAAWRPAAHAVAHYNEEITEYYSDLANACGLIRPAKTPAEDTPEMPAPATPTPWPRAEVRYNLLGGILAEDEEKELLGLRNEQSVFQYLKPQNEAEAELEAVNEEDDFDFDAELDAALGEIEPTPAPAPAPAAAPAPATVHVDFTVQPAEQLSFASPAALPTGPEPAPGPRRNAVLAGVTFPPQLVAVAAAPGLPGTGFDAALREHGVSEVSPLLQHLGTILSQTSVVALPAAGLPATKTVVQPSATAVSAISRALPNLSPEEVACRAAADGAVISLRRLRRLANVIETAFTEGAFSRCKQACTVLLAASVLLEPSPELSELLTTVRTYRYATDLELERRAAAAAHEDERALLCAALFGLTPFENPAHVSLACRAALMAFVKAKMYDIAGFFATRLLEAGCPDDFVDKARKVVALGARARADGNVSSVPGLGELAIWHADQMNADTVRLVEGELIFCPVCGAGHTEKCICSICGPAAGIVG